ncbi:MAG: hypothetical protein ACYC26_09450 [Phycisphaerales bacterium]
MTQGTFKVTFALFTCLILAAALTVRAAGPAPAGPEWYRIAWSEKELAGRTVAKRAELACELLDAARAQTDNDRGLFLAHKAYEWGSRDMEGYVSAAEALNLIQKTAPDQRVWCLEQMAGLYDSAYRARPTKLRLGSGLGETLMELAQQRMDSGGDQFADGQIDTAGAIAVLRQCQADLQRASSAFRQVIGRAEADARKVRSIHRNDIAASLDRFAAEFRPKLDEIGEFRDRVDERQGVMSRIQSAEAKYKARPAPAAADALATAYAAQLDQPERVDAAMLKLLTDPLNKWIPLACKPPKDLSADQASGLAKWYLDLLAGATGDDAKLDLATRAALYARQAVAAKAADAQPLLDKATTLAAGLGSDTGYFDTRIRDLAGRLNWLNAHPLVIAPAPGSVASSSPETRNSEPETSPPAPVAVNNNPTPAPAPTTTTGDVTIVNGRPMVRCATCGRLFFAGYGDDHPTVCPRCASGRKNIFDFGED